MVADEKALGNILARVDDDAVLFCFLEIRRRDLRLRRDLQVKNADDMLFGQHHVVADMKVISHKAPLCGSPDLT